MPMIDDVEARRDSIRRRPSKPYKLKLIEVALPLEDINREAAREKSIRYGHPSTLHLWWARRPLAACRAVLFAQLVDDPSERPDEFSSEAEQEIERKRLFGIISELVKWENRNNEDVLEEARAEIRKSCAGKPPPILDPFAGGGSIPLEAQRLDLDALARDLNPVAVLINKALIEIPPKWAGHPPVFPRAKDEANSWPGATGLAEDVLRYGQWMRDEAEKKIGHIYPKAEIGGTDAVVIAWLWARTITCPNPLCGALTPLTGSFWLARKPGKQRYIVPVREGKGIRFTVRGPSGVPPQSTVSRKGAECLVCGTPMPVSYMRKEGQADRMGTQLMAIVAEGKRRRYYLPPNAYHENAAAVPRPAQVPEEELAKDNRNLWCAGYGLTKFADLFTNRQLTALTTLIDLVGEARRRLLADSGSADYADAVTTYLALIVSRVTNRNSAICTWDSSRKMESLRSTFARQALPMTWDFAEGNIFGSGSGNFMDACESTYLAIRNLPANRHGSTEQQDAALGNFDGRLLVATDPPYYDNISYANLSDFFYVWLRRALAGIYPELMSTMLTPKDAEIVADPLRHPGKGAADEFFKRRFQQAFRRIRQGTPKGYPISFFYAYKQTEEDGEGARASTGWETLLDTILSAGWMITATWPVQTELRNRMRSLESNALMTSVILACRPRPEDAAVSDRRGLIAALQEEMPIALQKLEQGGIAPVDLRQAAIGPGMAVFSRYARINEPNGEPMKVRTALSLINQALDGWLSQLEGDISADTRWCVEWFKRHGFGSGSFGDADSLSRGIDTDPSALHRTKVIEARGGRVRLLSVQDISSDYDPSRGGRVSEWTICLHLAKRLREQGSAPAARLMAEAKSRVKLDAVKELTYLLYSIADEKRWSETALLFNELGTLWTQLEDESRKQGHLWSSPALG